jgi:hypothetical protein
MTMVNAFSRFVRAQYKGAPGTAADLNMVLIDIAAEKALAADPAALLDRLDLLLLSGRMSTPMRDALLTHLTAVPAGDGTQRAVEAIFLVATSPEFAVQK